MRLGRTRHRRWRAAVAGSTLVVGLASAAVGLGAALPQSPVAAAPAGEVSIASNGCGASCPTVSANPTSEIGNNQWSYVTLSQFPVDDVVSVTYCSDATPADLSNEPCDSATTSSVVVLSDGTAATSIQLLQADPSSPLPGDNGTPFDCTNDEPCAIDVTDPFLNGTSTKSTANTAVIPVTFATSAAACPQATTVTTASEYGLIQELLLASAPAACAASTAGTAPASAFDTELNSVNAAEALASGSDIAFVDNPDDPAVQTALGGASAHVAYIPVAVTANVVGFKATESFTSSSGNTSTYPDNAFVLTPTMVAGFVSNLSSYQQDNPPPDPVSCTTARGASTCSLINELNPPQPGFGQAAAYGAFVRGGTSGSTYSLETWLCGATKVPVPLPGGGTATEAMTPQQTLASGFTAAAGATACPANDQFPALSPGGGNWFSGTSPTDQANKLEAGLASQTTPSAFFAPMVWSEAFYNGLNIATLQNGAGALVQPTAASIDAGLADATTNANGTLTYDDADAGDAAAYPMPDVVYAVVPTSAVPATTAAADRSVLEALLSESSPTAATALPGGFVPLTSALYAQGEAAVAKALPAATSPGPPSTKTTPTTARLTGLLGADSLLGSLGLSGGLGLLGESPLATALLKSVTALADAGPGKHAGVLVIPQPLHMELLASNTSWLVPWFVRLLVIAAVLGPLLLVGLQVYRRRAGPSGVAEEADDDEGLGDVTPLTLAAAPDPVGA